MRGESSYQQDAVYHIYQRTIDGGLIFYSVKDYVVFFTYISFAASRTGMTILGICFMPDHIHLVVRARCKEMVSAFVDLYASGFVREYNKWYGREGPLFDPRFGRAVKVGDKKIRTALAYLYNNPVEKKLSPTADSYQWNFLRYAVTDHPFSERLLLEKASFRLRRAIKAVKHYVCMSSPVKYIVLRDCVAGLDEEDVHMLVDRIVTLCTPIDYQSLMKYYGSDYSRMVMAFNSNTGSEYDIAETFIPGDDRVYYKMSALLFRCLGESAVGHMYAFDDDERNRWAMTLARETTASKRQIEKFLHIGSGV